MKNCIVFIFVSHFFSFSYSQSSFDVRNTYWGMTVQEVIESEKPLKSYLEGNELNYYNVEIGNSLTARIIYSFRNGRLFGIKYVVLGLKSGYTKGTCENIIGFSKKVGMTNFIITYLEDKGFFCDMGWYFPNIIACPILGKTGWSKNCSREVSVLASIEKQAGICKVERPAINLVNDRTDVVFYYNEWQNVLIDPSILGSCNSDFFNTLCWIEFSPSSALKTKIEKGGF